MCTRRYRALDVLTRPITPRHWQIRCCALLLYTLLAGQVWAAESPPSYRVGVEDVDYYPIFSAAPPDYLYRGYARDLLDLFASHERIHLTYVPLPVRRLSHEFRAGRLDLIFPDNPRWEVVEKAQLTIAYSKPLLVFQDAMLVLPQRLGEPLQNYRTLGFIRGFTPWKFQEQVATGLVQIKNSPNPQGLIHMTLSGYIDAANMAQQVAHYHLKQKGQPNSLVIEPRLLPLQDSHYYLSSIQHPQLIHRFDAFLVRERKAVRALKVKYGLE